ncbi:RING-H2 finger protein ATL8 [Abeliophyllum distichum]|uniref:RING-H2 finger protein ATL8 n=1 Tax=Abeliophyllum distichum TaxID=126358 RepID=A0ABD1VC45_9LAMI
MSTLNGRLRKRNRRCCAAIPPCCGKRWPEEELKKVLKYLPKLTYATNSDNLSDRAICLAEFAVGDELRVLPQCCHGFHVECIDTWLGFHSSCPSCRRNVVMTSVRSAAAVACQSWPDVLLPPPLEPSPSQATGENFFHRKWFLIRAN